MPPATPCTPSHVSVNRVQIVDLPGLPIDEEVRGRRAHDLLSSRAIIRYARGMAETLNLPAAFAQDTLQIRRELPRFVDGCLSSPDDQKRAAARAIGQRLGRNLGHILLTLHRGDPINRAAREDWTDQDWERWAKIRRVWLGGGLMSGRLGALIVEHARAFLAETDHEGVPEIGLTHYPDTLALLGAGRYLPATTRHALCLDFGHTQVKRACLAFAGGALAQLQQYAPLPTVIDWLGRSLPQNPGTGRQVLDFMAGIVAQTWSECRDDDFTPGPDVMLIVAAYVQGGRLLGNGLYANLNTLADDVRPLLTGAIQARMGHKLRVRLIHDGTAACAVYAGEWNSAVLMVGTALGIGFTPGEADDLRPLSPALALRR